MAPLNVRAVARRIAFVQFDIAEQARAHVTAFQQIVTEDAVFRQAILQRELEHIDVVDALADERALAEGVLVDVRHGARVRIDAGVAGVQSREQ